MEAASMELKVTELKPSKNVIRADFEKDLADLMQSMKVSGLLHPIVVRKNGTGYEVVAGHRRLAAAKKLNWATVPCRVIHINDNEQTVMNITENLNREDVTLAECYFAFNQLKESGLNMKEIAAQVGVSEKRVKETFTLGNQRGLEKFADKIVFQNQEKQDGKLSYNKVLRISAEARKKGLTRSKTQSLLKHLLFSS